MFFKESFWEKLGGGGIELPEKFWSCFSKIMKGCVGNCNIKKLYEIRNISLQIWIYILCGRLYWSLLKTKKNSILFYNKINIHKFDYSLIKTWRFFRGFTILFIFYYNCILLYIFYLIFLGSNCILFSFILI